MAKSGNETADRSLHICPECGSGLVQPTCWRQEGDRTRWRVWRRCPECEWACESVHEVDAIDAFDEQLDLGAHELADELQALEQANMSEMADAFAVALWSGLIMADDFRV
ncbi:MAG TPA: hypothetical protein VFP21_02365 [Solirubrobacterales bacterium]|nr:hypothetical protein [Solirubrobacterales bacterium]